MHRASQVVLVVKNPPANAGDVRDVDLIRKIPWRRAWQPTPVFLPGESHGQRSLAGCSPWGHKESDTTEQLSTHTQGCRKLRVGWGELYGVATRSAQDPIASRGNSGVEQGA